MAVQHNPTEEQQTIINFVRVGVGSLIVGALAGSGKTWTILKSLEVIPQQSILLAAFGRDIADELTRKLPKMPKTHGVHVKTFHAAGLNIIRKHFPGLEVSREANAELINHVAGASINFKMRRAALKLLRITKETIATPTPPASDELLALGYQHDVFTAKMQDREISLVVEAVRDAYIVSLNLAARECIDFSDMVWAPVACGLSPPSRYLAVVVDELQDISGPQMQLLEKLMVPDRSRFIGIGDKRQSIYSWRGANANAMFSHAIEKFKATVLPLTMSFRNPKRVVARANEIVPELRAHPEAIEGTEIHCKLGELPYKLANSRSDYIHTFVLSRNNADLVDAALFLWRERVMFTLNTGKELLDPIFDLLSNKLDTRDEAAFRKSLDEWFGTESAKAEKANATIYQEKIEEQRAMLLATLKYAKPSQITKLLNEILVPNQSGILLSTVHKVKGKEAERVYLLKQTFARHQDSIFRLRDPSDNEILDEWTVRGAYADEEELNIEYVGITRAKELLAWVDVFGAGVLETPDKTFVLSTPLETFTIEQLAERLQTVELMATRTGDTKLADAFMRHARKIERALEAADQASEMGAG